MDDKTRTITDKELADLKATVQELTKTVTRVVDEHNLPTGEEVN